MGGGKKNKDVEKQIASETKEWVRTLKGQRGWVCKRKRLATKGEGKRSQEGEGLN